SFAIDVPPPSLNTDIDILYSPSSNVDAADTSSACVNGNKTKIATNIGTKNFITFCILIPPKYYFFFLKAKEYIKIIAIPTSRTMTIMVPALTPDFSSSAASSSVAESVFASSTSASSDSSLSDAPSSFDSSSSTSNNGASTSSILASSKSNRAVYS